MSILQVDSLEKTYGRRRVVDGVSLKVERGEIVGLLGPNGAGKTTTFRMICGLAKPDRGKVQLAGTDVTNWPMYERARNGGMGYLPQQSSIFGKLTVQQNLISVMQLLKFTRKEQKRRCDELLQQFKIEKLRKSRASKLSGGERRRLEIARCLVSKPEIIMLDEPFAGIDPVTVQNIQGVIEELRDQGIAILITDHAAREILQTTDRTYVVSEGRILCSGSAEEIVQHEEVKRKYLGEIEFTKTNGERDDMPAEFVDPESTELPIRLSESADHPVQTPDPTPTKRNKPKPKPIPLPQPVQDIESKPSISFGAMELTDKIQDSIEIDAASPSSQVESLENRSPVNRGLQSRVVDEKDRSEALAGLEPAPELENQAVDRSNDDDANGLRDLPEQRPNRKRVPRRKLIKRKRTLAKPELPTEDTPSRSRRIILESDPDPAEGEFNDAVETEVPTARPIQPSLEPASNSVQEVEPIKSDEIVFEEIEDETTEEATEESSGKRVRSAIRRPKINKVAHFRDIQAPFSSSEIDDV